MTCSYWINTLSRIICIGFLPSPGFSVGRPTQCKCSVQEQPLMIYCSAQGLPFTILLDFEATKMACASCCSTSALPNCIQLLPAVLDQSRRHFFSRASDSAHHKHWLWSHCGLCPCLCRNCSTYPKSQC